MSNPNAYVGELVELISHLGQAVSRETNLLAEKRPSELGQFTEERERLTTEYQTQVHAIRSDPRLLQSASEETRLELKLAMKQFHELLNEHRRAVFAARTMTQRLISSVTDEFSRRNRPAAGYNRQAQMAQPMANRRAQPVSLALNEVV